MRSKAKANQFKVLLYNLSHLTFAWIKNDELLSLKTKSGKILTTLNVSPGYSKEEIVFQILDKALKVEILAEDGSKAFYAFVNPFTTQIALGSVPETKAFDGSNLVNIDTFGKWLEFSDGLLFDQGQPLKIIEPDYSLIKSIINNS